MVLANRQPARVAPWGLERSRRGRDVVVFGGSQLGGANTGQFGSLDLPAVGAPSNAIPSGITVIVDGVTQSSYDAVHGIEPGIAEAIRVAGQHAGARILCRYVNSTDAQDWIDTHFATVAADVVAAGLTPCVAVYCLASQDALSAAVASAMRPRLRRLQGLVEAAWSGCGWAVFPQVTTDTGTYPALAESRAYGTAYLQDLAGGGRRHVLDHTSITLQTDNQHPTSAGNVQLGLRVGRALVAFGVTA